MREEVDSVRYGREFHSMLGQLKRAAIDAYMASKGFWQRDGRYVRLRIYGQYPEQNQEI